MGKSKISIITVSFNSIETIRDTLESVQRQTYPNIEYVIVDGASTDGTVELISSYSNNIDKFISEQDSGIYDAYNKGLQLSDGEIVGFLNSDDFYVDDSIISRVMDEFEDPSIDAVYGDLIYVSSNDKSKPKRLWKSKKYKKGLFQHAFVPAHPTLFLRRSTYDKVGEFDTNFHYSGDFDLMLRAFHCHQVSSKYVPFPFVYMREGGQTGGGFKSIIKQNKEIFESFKKNDVNILKLYYVVRKIINRIVQRLRVLGF